MTSVTPKRLPGLSDKSAAVVWAVAMDDDDLASMFIDAAIAKGAATFIAAIETYPPNREARLHHLLGELRAECARDRTEFAHRMQEYLNAENDMPF